MFASVVNYLEKIGLKKARRDADVSIIGPGGSYKKASLYLLLNPLACIPPLHDEFPALYVIERKMEKEFREFEARLKELGAVRAVPWSVPPSYHS